MDNKFIDSCYLSDYEILTDNGFVDIIGLHKTKPFDKYVIQTNNHYLECADNHVVFDQNFNEIFVKELKDSDKIITDSGIEKIEKITKINILENMYDFELGENSNHRYYTNGILSHNSTAYCIFCLWTCIFNEDQSILILANKENTAKEFIARMKLAYEFLPNWLKPGLSEWNKSKIQFGNGSSIEGSSTTPDSARGKSAKILIVDEALIYSALYYV